MLSTNQQMTVRLAETFTYFVMVFALVVPLGVAVAILAEIEPTHRLIHEWLETDFQINLGFLPFIYVMFIATYGVAWAACLMAMLIIMYYMTTTITIDAILPKQFYRNPQPQTGRGRCDLLTDGFGKIPDEMAIHLFIIQKLLNSYLNSFFMSPLVAFHHIGALSTVVVLLLVAIRYNEVLDQIGTVGYLVVFSCIATAMMLIYSQSKMAGWVVDISKKFGNSGRKLMPRSYMFRKFTRSCTPFYIQVAYPFYNVHRETFPLFCEQTLVYTTQLLLYES